METFLKNGQWRQWGRKSLLLSEVELMETSPAELRTPLHRSLLLSEVELMETRKKKKSDSTANGSDIASFIGSGINGNYLTRRQVKRVKSSLLLSEVELMETIGI